MALDVLKGDSKLIADIKKGSTVIIGGGTVGLETAPYIAAKHFAVEES